MSKWLKAVRAPFFTATVMSGFLGGACAWHDTGNFNWKYFLLTIAGIIAANAGTNLVNDYFDHTSGADEINVNHNRFSGGSRVIQDGLIKPEKILGAGIAAFCAAAVIGLYLNSMTAGNVILYIGLAGIFLGYFYTAEPQTLSAPVFWISVPAGMLVALILLINGFTDYEADRQVKKRTMVVLLGRKKAVGLYRLFFFLSYLTVIAGAGAGIFPVFTLSVFVTLPLALRAVKIAGENYCEIIKLLPANEATIKAHFLFGLLLVVSYMSDRMIYGR